MKNARVFVLLILCSLFSHLMFAQDAIQMAKTRVDQNIVLKNYDKAYSSALFIMKFYYSSSETLDIETSLSVEQAVIGKLDSLTLNQDWASIVALKKDTVYYPTTIQSKTSSYFITAEKEIANKEAEERSAKLQKEQELKQKADEEAAVKRQQEQLETILSATRQFEYEKEKLRQASTQATVEQQKEIEALRQQSEEKYRAELTQMVEKINEANTKNIESISKGNTSMVLGFGILAFVVIICIAMLVWVALRHQKLQAEQFRSTMQAMQGMRTITPAYDTIALPFQMQEQMLLQSAQSQGKLLIGGTQDDTVDIEKEKVAIKTLLTSCEQYGKEIDKVTGRKNASRLVADLVYKISKQLGYSEQDSIIYFAVGLVYDIGFLNLDPAILRADCLSNEQFETLKTHTQIGLNMVFFVDEQWRGTFRDGVSKHHENLDGSGYPNGIKAKEIPYIARVLRVTESYIALISSRDYKQIKDRNAAIAELRENAEQYDETIVDALDAIV